MREPAQIIVRLLSIGAVASPPDADAVILHSSLPLGPAPMRPADVASSRDALCVPDGKDRPKVLNTRLQAIDCLRAAAALGVVIYHLTLGTRVADAAQVVGYAGVYLFFVLSGFCIHLRWAREYSAGQNPSQGFLAFWNRRVRRLYPAYLAAVVLYIVLPPLVIGPRGEGLTGKNLVLHLLMLHNFSPSTVYAICPVFWTLAIEEQLYLAYFLLRPIRMRLGWTRTLSICLLNQAMVQIGFRLLNRHHVTGMDYTSLALWYWFIWAVGAMTAEATVGIVELPALVRSRSFPLFAWTGVLCLYSANIFAGAAHHAILEATTYAIPPLMAVGIVPLVWRFVLWEQHTSGAARPAALRWAASVGLFSYSLYLTHMAIISAGRTALSLSPLLAASLELTVCLAFAWAFYRLCERPFLPASPRALTSGNGAALPAAARLSGS